MPLLAKKKTVEFFFGHFCDVKKPIKRLGKPVRTQKKHIAKIFFPRGATRVPNSAKSGGLGGFGPNFKLL